MAKKSKKQVKNKNKNINKIIVNVNSNNKKKVISKQKGQQQQSSAPIVISNPSPMFYPQYQQPPTTQLIDNSYGLGSHKLLEGLTTRIENIKDEFIHQAKQNQMENIRRMEFIKNISNGIAKPAKVSVETNTDKLPTVNADMNTSLLKTNEVGTDTINNAYMNTPSSKTLTANTFQPTRSSTPKPQDKFNIPSKPRFNSAPLRSRNINDDIELEKNTGLLSPQDNQLFSNRKSSPTLSTISNISTSSRRNNNDSFLEDFKTLVYGLSPLENETNLLEESQSVSVAEKVKDYTPSVSAKAISEKEMIKQILEKDERISNDTHPKYKMSFGKRGNSKRNIGDVMIIYKKSGNTLEPDKLESLYRNTLGIKTAKKTQPVKYAWT